MDGGVAFNPLEDKPEKDEDAPGGFGILMATSLVDKITYERRGEFNILRFVKKIS